MLAQLPLGLGAAVGQPGAHVVQLRLRPDQARARLRGRHLPLREGRRVSGSGVLRRGRQCRQLLGGFLRSGLPRILRRLPRTPLGRQCGRLEGCRLSTFQARLELSLNSKETY